MLKTVREKIMPGIVLAFITSAIGFGFTWFQNYYNQPRIVINTTGYYSNFNGNLVGHITITNEGKSAAEDITINVYSKVNKGEIKTDGASTKNNVVIDNDETKFIIEKLNYRETAFLSFSSLDKESLFGVEASLKSGTYLLTDTPPDWWEFNTVQILFILTVSLFALLVGIYLGKPVKTTKSRR